MIDLEAVPTRLQREAVKKYPTLIKMMEYLRTAHSPYFISHIVDGITPPEFKDLVYCQCKLEGLL